MDDSKINKQILIDNLIDALQGIAYRDTARLELFKEHAEAILKSFDGDTSNYRFSLKMTRFAPWSANVGEEEFIKSWNTGKIITSNIFKAVNEDPKITFKYIDPHLLEEIKSQPPPADVPTPASVEVPPPEEIETPVENPITTNPESAVVASIEPPLEVPAQNPVAANPESDPVIPPEPLPEPPAENPAAINSEPTPATPPEPLPEVPAANPVATNPEPTPVAPVEPLPEAPAENSAATIPDPTPVIPPEPLPEPPVANPVATTSEPTPVTLPEPLPEAPAANPVATTPEPTPAIPTESLPETPAPTGSEPATQTPALEPGPQESNVAPAAQPEELLVSNANDLQQPQEQPAEVSSLEDHKTEEPAAADIITEKTAVPGGTGMLKDLFVKLKSIFLKAPVTSDAVAPAVDQTQTPARTEENLPQPQAEPVESQETVVPEPVPGDPAVPAEAIAPDPQAAPEPAVAPAAKLSKRILIVNGSDVAMNEKVLAMLTKLGFEGVLSYSEENYSKTVASKMLEFQDISFVIVLLTYDGYFYLKDQKVSQAKLISNYKVIFEMGYLIGKIGRNKVFVLYPEKKNFELPSLFFDAYYIPYDKSRAWEKELIKTLADQGYPVNQINASQKK